MLVCIRIFGHRPGPAYTRTLGLTTLVGKDSGLAPTLDTLVIRGQGHMHTYGQATEHTLLSTQDIIPTYG